MNRCNASVCFVRIVKMGHEKAKQVMDIIHSLFCFQQHPAEKIYRIRDNHDSFLMYCLRMN